MNHLLQLVEWQGVRVAVQTATRNGRLYLLVRPIASADGDTLLVDPQMLWGSSGDISVNKDLISATTGSGKIRIKVTP